MDRKENLRTRKQVPNARSLKEIPSGIRSSLMVSVSNILKAATLARIKSCQACSDELEEEKMFDNDGDDVPDKHWDTFDNLISDRPEKGVTQPVTVSTETKIGLASMFIAVADLVNKVGKLPSKAPIDHLINSPWREANIVRIMAAATEASRHILRTDPLCREFDFPTVLRQKFEALISSKDLVDPGVNEITKLFINFVKLVGANAATSAYESGHCTLNKNTFLGILAWTEAQVPENDAPAVRDVLNFVRTQIERWKLMQSKIKKATAKKAPAKKAPAAKPATKVPASSDDEPMPSDNEPAPSDDEPAPSDDEPAPSDDEKPASAATAATAKPAAAKPAAAATAAKPAVTAKPAAAATAKPAATAATTAKPAATAAATAKPATAAAKPAAAATAAKPPPELNYDELLSEIGNK